MIWDDIRIEISYDIRRGVRVVSLYDMRKVVRVVRVEVCITNILYSHYTLY